MSQNKDPHGAISLLPPLSSSQKSRSFQAGLNVKQTKTTSSSSGTSSSVTQLNASTRHDMTSSSTNLTTGITKQTSVHHSRQSSITTITGGFKNSTSSLSAASNPPVKRLSQDMNSGKISIINHPTLTKPTNLTLAKMTHSHSQSHIAFKELKSEGQSVKADPVVGSLLSSTLNSKSFSSLNQTSKVVNKPAPLPSQIINPELSSKKSNVVATAALTSASFVSSSSASSSSLTESPLCIHNDSAAGGTETQSAGTPESTVVVCSRRNLTKHELATGYGFNDEQIGMFEETFQIFDKDCDGFITPIEIRTVMNSLGFFPCEENIIKGIQNIDCDNSGTVDFEEFISMMSKFRSHVKSSNELDDELKDIFNIFDKNGDGFIDTNELKDVLVRLGETITDDEVSEMIKEADIDGDNKVSFSEFKSILYDSKHK